MAFLGLFRKAARNRARRPSSAPRVRPSVETLESRVVPYATSGNAWPSPQLITLSFMPDGTLVSSGVNGNVYSDLYATLNARMPTATWQDAVLTAAQTWAQQANINFAVVADNGTPAGQGNYQQGDPGMGDVRVGAYSLGSNYLGGTYMPPPANNYSIAGDMNFNDTTNWNNGTTYDLQTVALHELGHALGLSHSFMSSSAMWPAYNGVKRKLSSDDINGIQAIYGARQPDTYATGQNAGLVGNLVNGVVGLLGGSSSQNSNDVNNSFWSATNLSSLIDPTTLVAQAPSLNIISTSDVHYFTFTAPSGTASTATVTVQSSGLSLLRPSVTVYAADQVTVLGSAAAPGTDFTGATLTVPLSGVTAGEQIYVKVTGADTTAFGTGAYGLTVDFGSSTAPTVTPPNTQLLNGAVLQGGGAQPLMSQPMDDMAIDDAHITDPDFLRELAALNAAQAAAATPPAADAPSVSAPAVGPAVHAAAPAPGPAVGPEAVPGAPVVLAHLTAPGLALAGLPYGLASQVVPAANPTMVAAAAVPAAAQGPVASAAEDGGGAAVPTADAAGPAGEAISTAVPDGDLRDAPAAVPAADSTGPDAGFRHRAADDSFAYQGGPIAPTADGGTTAVTDREGGPAWTPAPLVVLAGALIGSGAVPGNRPAGRARRRPRAPSGG
jgi:predicted Zn-dependent protease